MLKMVEQKDAKNLSRFWGCYRNVAPVLRPRFLLFEIKRIKPKHAGRERPWWFRWSRICLQFRISGFGPWVRKIPWRREWLPTSVLLPGEFHGQKSLVGLVHVVAKNRTQLKN